ncbi:hypothetical protein [Nocardia sp. NPDC049707]|uniref:hypothetical protein n=1 Tax=Nocardia sp. NPDC049707 TaxID=3154735 RepID=UPI0034399FDD
MHCASDRRTDVTVIDASTACRAAAETRGRAWAVGYDGVGYAHASLGAAALGIGAGGSAPATGSAEFRSRSAPAPMPSR